MKQKASDVLKRLKKGEGPSEDQAAAAHASSVVDPQAFLAQIEHMRGLHRYGFADETLRGIYDSVEETEHVTDGQRRAIVNIRDSVLGREPFE
jgi:hypothetical protein